MRDFIHNKSQARNSVSVVVSSNVEVQSGTSRNKFVVTSSILIGISLTCTGFYSHRIQDCLLLKIYSKNWYRLDKSKVRRVFRAEREGGRPKDHVSVVATESKDLFSAENRIEEEI